MSENLKSYLKALVESSTKLARESVSDMDLAQASQSERMRQQNTANAVAAAVGSKDAKKKKVVDEKDDDLDLDSIFGDDGADKGKKSKASSGDKPSPDKKVPKPGDTDSSTSSNADVAQKKVDASKVATQDAPRKMQHSLPAAEDVTVDMVTSRINIIRAGKSFTDEQVSTELKHYFEKLSSPERLALLTFLTGLAGVVSGGVEGEDAQQPKSADVSISSPDKKQPEQKPEKKVSSNTSSDRVKVASRPTKTPAGEDTAPPIRVGERQTTESIRRKVRTLTW